MIAGMTAGVAAVAGGRGDLDLRGLTDADRAAARSRAGGAVDEDGIPVRMLDIPPDTFHRAYNNVANSTLWFVHHMLFDTPNQPLFGQQFWRDWESYLAYNQAFADALAEEALARDAPPGASRRPRRGGCAP